MAIRLIGNARLNNHSITYLISAVSLLKKSLQNFVNYSLYKIFMKFFHNSFCLVLMDDDYQQSRYTYPSQWLEKIPSTYVFPYYFLSEFITEVSSRGKFCTLHWKFSHIRNFLNKSIILSASVLIQIRYL